MLTFIFNMFALGLSLKVPLNLIPFANYEILYEKSLVNVHF